MIISLNYGLKGFKYQAQLKQIAWIWLAKVENNTVPLRFGYILPQASLALAPSSGYD